MARALDFSRRSEMPELLDIEPCSFDDYRRCMSDLARVNVLTRAYRPTLAFLDRIWSARGQQPQTLRIVDVGSGYGDMLRRIERWAAFRGVHVTLVGIDLNPAAAQAAAQAAGSQISWRTGDFRAVEPDEEIDIVISSLFAHHLDDQRLVEFLGWMERRARVGWFVNDLHRHVIPYRVFAAWSRLAGWHRYVQHDGPISIMRAFERHDWHRLIEAAGLSDAAVSIQWHLPFRLCLGRIRHA